MKAFKFYVDVIYQIKIFYVIGLGLEEGDGWFTMSLVDTASIIHFKQELSFKIIDFLSFHVLP